MTARMLILTDRQVQLLLIALSSGREFLQHSIARHSVLQMFHGHGLPITWPQLDAEIGAVILELDNSRLRP